MIDFSGRFVRSSPGKPFKCPQCGRDVIFHTRCLVPGCGADCHGLNPTMGWMGGLAAHSLEKLDDDPKHFQLCPLREISLAEVNDILETTVKRDQVSKSITFLNMVNA